MVDQIKNNIASASKTVASAKNSNNSTAKNTSVASTNVSNSNKEAKNSENNITKFISKSSVKEMSLEPPIDKSNVSRIKNAIATNNYPIDLEKIADALMDAYKEMK